MPSNFTPNTMPHVQGGGYYPASYQYPYAPVPYMPQYYHAAPVHALPTPQYGAEYYARAPQPSHGWHPPPAPMQSFTSHSPPPPNQHSALKGVIQDHSMLMPIHGPRFGAVTVTGDLLALAELQKAVFVVQLMVQETQPEANAHSLRVSARYHEQTGALPVIDGDTSFALHLLSSDELQSYGISEERVEPGAFSRFQHLGAPPFKDATIDKALLLLEALGKYHQNGKTDGPGVWQVCVITNYAGIYRVQLFKRKPLDVATHTLHLYREIIGTAHHYQEIWKGFVLSPDAPIPAQEQVSSSTSMSSGGKDRLNHGYESDDESSSDTLPVIDQSSRASSDRSSSVIRIISPGQLITRKLNGFEGVSCPDRDTRPCFPAHLTDEELLTGMVHPEDICGTLLLDLAKRNSNKKIAAHVLALYNALPGRRNKAMNPNCITKRITLALQSQAAKQGKDFETLKNAYYAGRKANGAQAKEEAKRGGSPAVRRRRVGRPRKAEAERPGKRARKSPSLSSIDSEDDLEEEFRDLHETERPAKRMRTTKTSLVKREFKDELDEEEKKPMVKKARQSTAIDTAASAPRTLRNRKSVVNYAVMDDLKIKKGGDSDVNDWDDDRKEVTRVKKEESSDDSDFDGGDDDEED